MFSAFVVLVLAIDDPTPPIPPRHPDEPVVDAPAKGRELGHGNAKDAAAKEAAARAAADKAQAGKPDALPAEKSAQPPAEKAEERRDAKPPPTLRDAHGRAEGHGKPDDARGATGSADAGVEPRAEANPPPSITSSALCDELRKSAMAKKAALSKIEEERKALVAERAKLEETAAEIARAREQLKEETQRLEALIEESKGLKPALGGAARAPTGPVVGSNVANLAKTMKAMKPAQAAQLVSRMDSRLAAQVLQQMSPKDSGAVLANVKADVAAELMASLAALPPVADPKKKR
jgi:flagellar motility protein MotE (MotC chaperone)